MKNLSVLIIAVMSVFAWTSCKEANARYIDLQTGETVMLEQDPKTGEMINAETGKPVRLYVNTKTKDTIFGPSGKIVNNEVIRTGSGMYVYSGDEEYKLKHEKDGYKEKWGDDAKVKAEGGGYKVKHGDYKKEVEKDGDITIKRGDTKIKIDGETGERKVKTDD